MVSLDEWLTLCADTFFFSPFPTQWFATVLSATEMTKLGHNNPFLSTVIYNIIINDKCSNDINISNSELVSII